MQGSHGLMQLMLMHPNCKVMLEYVPEQSCVWAIAVLVEGCIRSCPSLPIPDGEIESIRQNKKDRAHNLPCTS